MEGLKSCLLLLAALAFPLTAQAQEPASTSKPKEIVVVGSKIPELRTPRRALLLDPQDLDAAAGKASLEVSDATLANVLKRAFERQEGLGDLELRAAGDGGRQNYLLWELKNVRVTSYSVSGAAGGDTAQISWTQQVGGVEHEGTPTDQHGIEYYAVDAAGNQANDAITAARFSLTIDGVEIAQFSELAGINSSVRPVTIVLKRGKTTSRELWAWHEAAREGNMAAARKSASLVLYGYDGKPISRYRLESAWPSKIEVGGLARAKDAGSGQVAVETLELAHEGFLEMETVTIVAERIQRVSP